MKCVCFECCLPLKWWFFEKMVFSTVQLLSRVRLFVTPWITASQASLSITNSQSLLKLMSIESVMPSNHLIFCCPLLLLPPIPPRIRVFSNESTLRMKMVLLTSKSFLRLLSSDYLTFWFTHHVSFSNLGKVWRAWFKSIPMPAHPSVPMEEKRMCWGMRFRQHKIEVRLLPGYATARSKSAQWRTKTGRWWDF